MVAYFEFQQMAPDGVLNSFVFKLTDGKKIAEARNLLVCGGPGNSVQGTIIQEKAPYNPQWSFHLRPDSIGFFENQIEVCDANITYVEKHLDEIGGSTLPRSFWCPWSSALSAEVTELIDAETERPKS
jgi:hypothetical protein